MYNTLQTQFKIALETIPHMKTEHPEIELRLGSFDSKTNSFKSSIPSDVFTNILSHFQSGRCWSNTCVTSSVDYFRGSMRLSVDNDVITCIQKLKLGASDIKNEDGNIDVRLSISTEAPFDIPKDIDVSKPLENQKFDTIRSKVRYTFEYKGLWRYDFTVVNNQIFEIEIELVNVHNAIKMYNINYLAESATLKIKDILEMKNAHT